MSKITRRDLLTGAGQRIGAASMAGDHISSAVIAVLPAHREAVAERLRRLPGVEIHHSNAAKIVVVLEGPSSGALGAMLADISSWPGVLSANMVFEQRLDRETGNDAIAT
jgi:nitrate reductase NapD